ncbi:2-phosphosulfolactate phosphatase [Carboxylicivirga taeanensis]|uniref:2-phosphosulfolactate phosphatase n=1 Tax=Carboxylicivirga taeanensis TaxID=1416875 RepID=UPI003F6E001A
MNIEVIATAQQANLSAVKGKTAVVIDVLRATTVMVTALKNGATAVIPVLDPKAGFKIKEEQKGSIILGGERQAEIIPGFDFGNSPLSYTKEVVDGKTLVITTTNGTLALRNSMGAEELLVASFINSKAICELVSEKQELVLVCSGNNGLYTLEDALCAGQIIYRLEQAGVPVNCCDFALSVKALFESHKNNVAQFAACGYHYNVLKNKGYSEDLEYCFTNDVCNTIPVWREGALVKL